MLSLPDRKSVSSSRVNPGKVRRNEDGPWERPGPPLLGAADFQAVALTADLTMLAKLTLPMVIHFTHRSLFVSRHLIIDF